MQNSSHGLVDRALSWLLPFLVISAAYLYTFPQPTIFYAVVVLLHALGGVVTAILLIPALLRRLRSGTLLARAGWLLTAAGAVLGLVLLKTGTPRSEWRWLYFHIVISLIGVGLLVAEKVGGGAGSLQARARRLCAQQSVWSLSPGSAMPHATPAKVGRRVRVFRIPPCLPAT